MSSFSYEPVDELTVAQTWMFGLVLPTLLSVAVVRSDFGTSTTIASTLNGPAKSVSLAGFVLHA
jgi:hypothetical protein